MGLVHHKNLIAFGARKEYKMKEFFMYLVCVILMCRGIGSILLPLIKYALKEKKIILGILLLIVVIFSLVFAVNFGVFVYGLPFPVISA